MTRMVGARSRICVLAMGGTIAMRKQVCGGVMPVDGAAALLEGLDFGENIAVEHHDVSLKPSASINLFDVATLARLVRELANSGADGVVVTHGTDTLEETAFALQLMLGATIPVVLTGAMRSADSLSPDGPANLVSAIRTAAHPDAQGQGVLVAFGDEIHAAQRIRKIHSTCLRAFSSGLDGCLGHLTEGKITFTSTLRTSLPHLELGANVPVVPILQAGMDLEAATVALFSASNVDALVVAGVGGGHVSANAVFELEKIARSKPVVITGGVDFGATLENSYSYPGGDIDLRRRGLINGGRWRANKARIIVQLALSSGQTVVLPA